MKTNTVWKSFLEESQTLGFSHTYANGVYYHLIVTIKNNIFSEHIKDLCIEHIHPLFEMLSDNTITINVIEGLVEETLQNVNHALSLFIEDINIKDSIHIDGALAISHQGNILVSLIGDASLIISRNGTSIYNMSNSEHNNTTGSISLFTDYISGQIHIGDSILILGYDHSLIFHNKELHKLSNIIFENEPDMLEQIESMLTHRIETHKLGFISLVRNISHTIDFQGISRRAKILQFVPNSTLKRLHGQFATIWDKHSYQITLGVLGLIVVFAIYNTLSGALTNTSNEATLTTPDGIKVISIDDIKRDINLFNTLHPDDPTKGEKFKTISDQLEFLKSQNRRPEDVAALQKVLEEQYMKGFNIITINNFNDSTNEFKKAYSLSNEEQSIIGDSHSLYSDRGFYIGGTKGALIKGINNDIKGTVISYSLADEMKKCSQDLSKNGLYCFDAKNNIYRIIAGSVQPITTINNITLPTDIQDIGIFGRNNLYLMINPQTNGGGNDLIRRYTLQAGSFSTLANNLSYTFVGGENNEQPNFSSMTIDGNFLTWSKADKALYLMRRNPANNTLNNRIIQLQGGDTTYLSYSDDVKIIAPSDSRYVYLFDRTNKTFTVYSSDPLKTTQGNATTYSLRYIMRYTFDSTLAVGDVTVPEGLGNRPVLYILTKEGIFETNLNSTIAFFDKTAI